MVTLQMGDDDFRVTNRSIVPDFPVAVSSFCFCFLDLCFAGIVCLIPKRCLWAEENRASARAWGGPSPLCLRQNTRSRGFFVGLTSTATAAQSATGTPRARSENSATSAALRHDSEQRSVTTLSRLPVTTTRHG